ncbi:hypothetical protein ACJW30_11G146800 [Castanea mollissima]
MWGGLLVTSVIGGNNETDRSALLEFKAKIIHDPLGALSSRNDSIHFCQWQGVTCGRRHQRVTVLDLQSLKLVGSISPYIGNLSFLKNLTLQNNSLHNEIPLELEIPAKLGILSKLQYIPPSLGNLSTLEVFATLYNNLVGSTPDSFGQLTKLTFIDMSSNMLSGTIPPSIFNLTSLVSFDLNGILSFLICLNHLGRGGANDLSFLCSLTNATYLTKLQIQTLEMWNNRLSSNIPFEIGKLPKLQYLALSQNNFFGNMPSSLGNLLILTNLYLNENNLEGSIPLGKCQNVVYLNLQVIGLSFSPIGLDLSDNKFTGVLPMEVGNFKNLEYLDISKNMLFGEIPTSLDSYVKLEFLAMSRNFFQGVIPSSLESLRSLKVLELSNNNLSGNIPIFLENFDFLQLLNLSYNNFEGEVPIEGVFKSTSATSIKGNIELCGGMLKFKLPICKYNKSEKRKLIHSLKLIMSILSGPFGVTLMISFLFLFSFKQKRRESILNNSQNLLLNVSYQCLLKATDAFSFTNVIGVGSFEFVYRGILDQDRHIVALPRVSLLKCDALRSIRHQNLVKVLTTCSTVDYQGHDFKALVYEFMSNGNLDDRLHPTASTNEAPLEETNLNILQRLNIAIDVANALEYLHHHFHTKIVHCDLKPSNVLLDDQMIRHVGDFGLAKFLLEASQDCSTNQSNSIGLRGTIEYGMGNEVSTNGNIYSYGILLLEMFKGKRPTDTMFKDSLNIHDFVNGVLLKRMIDIVDPTLHLEKEDMETRTNCLIFIFEIGVSCSMEFPRERMNISDVVAQLNLIREKLLGTKICKERVQLNGKFFMTQYLF